MTIRLPAGTYYVGDLCYILGDNNGYDWMHVLNATNYLRGEGEVGACSYNGISFFCSGTMYGDGSYNDDEGRSYGVDAGIIGCFPVCGLPEGFDSYGGHVVVFPQAFVCEPTDTPGNDEGTIRIGHLDIETR